MPRRPHHFLLKFLHRHQLGFLARLTHSVLALALGRPDLAPLRSDQLGLEVLFTRLLFAAALVLSLVQNLLQVQIAHTFLFLFFLSLAIHVVLDELLSLLDQLPEVPFAVPLRFLGLPGRADIRQLTSRGQLGALVRRTGRLQAHLGRLDRI